MKKANTYAKVKLVLAVCLVGLLLLFCLHSCTAKPLDNSVTIAGIAQGVQSEYILAKAGDSYYELSSSSDFISLFSFDDWILIEDVPSDEPILTLRLAELWLLHFYSDGIASAHNGYALREYSQDAYYSISVELMEQLVSYISTNGIPHQIGDDTIGLSTFAE